MKRLSIPTKLSEELIFKYQLLAKEQFGVVLSLEDSEQEALELIGFYVALLNAEMANIRNGCGVIELDEE